jgi:hypothetical protein
MYVCMYVYVYADSAHLPALKRAVEFPLYTKKGAIRRKGETPLSKQQAVEENRGALEALIKHLLRSPILSHDPDVLDFLQVRLSSPLVAAPSNLHLPPNLQHSAR